MNKVLLIGNIAKDIEVKTTQNGKKVCQFSVACQRKVPNANGEREADFINCVAWEKTAEFIEKYFSKGKKIALEGHLNVRSYQDQDGSKRWSTDVMVESVEFVERRSETAQNTSTAVQTNNAPVAQNVGFEQVDTEELPF